MITGGATGPRHSYGSITAGGAIENGRERHHEGDFGAYLQLASYAVRSTLTIGTNAMITTNAYTQNGFICETAKGSTLVSTVGFDFIAVGT
jgi:hypothetical protein